MRVATEGGGSGIYNYDANGRMLQGRDDKVGSAADETINRLRYPTQVPDSGTRSPVSHKDSLHFIFYARLNAIFSVAACAIFHWARGQLD